jgi:hypothetical protein
MRRSLACLVLVILALGAFARAGDLALRSECAQFGPPPGLTPAAWDARSAARTVRWRVAPRQLVEIRDPRDPLTRE